MPKGNTDNLRPIQSTSEAREKGRRGGIKSGEVRRAKKEKYDLLKMVLDIPIKDATQREKLSQYGIKDSAMTNSILTEIALVEQAKMGDIAAKKYIDERVGVNPMLELRKRELDRKEKESQADTSTIELVFKVLEEVKKQADEINKQAGNIHTGSDP